MMPLFASVLYCQSCCYPFICSLLSIMLPPFHLFSIVNHVATFFICPLLSIILPPLHLHPVQNHVAISLKKTVGGCRWIRNCKEILEEYWHDDVVFSSSSQFLQRVDMKCFCLPLEIENDALIQSLLLECGCFHFLKNFLRILTILTFHFDKVVRAASERSTVCFTRIHQTCHW